MDFSSNPPTTDASGCPVPRHEADRLKALNDYEILDTLPEKNYDDLAAIAAYICGTPISLISLIDSDRQWFKARHGIDATATPREQAFCAYAICQPEEVLMVPNALEDPRFAQNPLVTGDPEIRFYAGAPLVTSEGLAVGTLCVIDRQPRQLTQQQIDALQALSRQVISQLELRRQAKQLQQEVQLRSQMAQIAADKSAELAQALAQLQKTQVSLVQSEKMSALGRLVAGVAHEINNPISFIEGNLHYCKSYFNHLVGLIRLYQTAYPKGSPEINCAAEDCDLNYLSHDLPRLLNSMQIGSHRIQSIVQLLRVFSRLDESETKVVDLHHNLDATLTLMEYQLAANQHRPAIQVTRCYGDVPQVHCAISQLNQVFMQLLSNAIDALDCGVGCKHLNEPQPTICIQTETLGNDRLRIQISDNGVGISEMGQQRMFDPFYTTKPVGKGTGMGLAIAYQIIVDLHGGQLHCESEPGLGTTLTIEIVHAPNLFRFKPVNPLGS
ncbi:MAG: sensor histidine kinase [Oscillatoriales cyanobacterium]|nr:MAG: sensor histidine kinase [Oscillatoriales cyanobacterium]